MHHHAEALVGRETAGSGSYPDKLTYVPHPPGTPPNWPPPFQPPTSADPVDGNWTCIQNPNITLSLTVQDEISGYLTGTLNTATGSVPLTGFTDTGAGAGANGLTLQGLTVAALLPDGHMVVTIAGSLNLNTGSLTMSWLESNGTAADSTYTQTLLGGWILGGGERHPYGKVGARRGRTVGKGN